MILHCGESLIDFIPGTPDHGSAGPGQESFLPVAGGSPFNSAISSARLGTQSAFFGKISTDFFGDQIWDALGTNGVDRTFAVRSDQPSTLAFVKKNSRGEAQYAFFAENAADRDVTELPDLPANISAIHVGSISLIPEPVGSTLEALVRREHARRVVSLDPNIRPTLIRDETAYRARLSRLIGMAAVVKVSDEDLIWMTGTHDLETAANAVRAEGPALVVVTKGAAGVFCVGANGFAEADSVPVAVVDTIGAGDSFHAAILTWLERTGKIDLRTLKNLSTDDMAAMIEFGANVAAVTCSRRGADPPRMTDLPERIRLA